MGQLPLIWFLGSRGVQPAAVAVPSRAVFPAGYILVNNFRLANCILRAHSVSLS